LLFQGLDYSPQRVRQNEQAILGGLGICLGPQEFRQSIPWHRAPTLNQKYLEKRQRATALKRVGRD
jgi:hypothetical protein